MPIPALRATRTATLLRRLGPTLALSAALLGLAWPALEYHERARTQVAAIVEQRDDQTARIAGSLGDMPMSNAIVGGPIVGRPLLDLIRKIVEPQSSAAQVMLGVNGKPGGLYAIRKLLEGMVFAIMIPALLITLTMKMVVEQMNFRDASLAALKPWSLAALALLTYPLIDMVTYWGVGRPLAQQIGSYEIKKGVMMGILNSGAVDDEFGDWANAQYNANSERPEARRANAAGGVASGMNLTAICARAISTASTMESLFEPTDPKKTPYELRECRSGSVSIEAKLLMMRNIMNMSPVLEGESGDGANLLTEVGLLIKSSPGLIAEIFENDPSTAAAETAIAAAGGDPGFWASLGATIAKWGSRMANPMRFAAEMFQNTVAGVVAGLVTMLVVLFTFLLAVEAEFARAFSLALAPVAIGWALFPSGQQKLMAWLKGHTAACLRVAGAELAGLVMMTLVFGISMFPLRNGGFGMVLTGFTTIFAIFMLFKISKSMSDVMAGDITAASATLAKGATTALGASVATVAVAAGGAVAATKLGGAMLAKAAASRAGGMVAKKGVAATSTATRWSNRYKGMAAKVGEEPNAAVMGGVQKASKGARSLFEKTKEAARSSTREVVDKERDSTDRTASFGSVGAKNFDAQNTSSRLERVLRNNPDLAGVDTRVQDKVNFVRGDGSTLAVLDKQQALATETREALRAGIATSEYQKRILEDMRASTREEREATAEMAAVAKQAMLVTSVDEGGVRAALAGRFGEDENGNRTFALDEDSLKRLLLGLETDKTGRLKKEIRQLAFDSGMLDAKDEDVTLEDVLKKSRGVQIATALIYEDDLLTKADTLDRAFALKAAGVPATSALGAVLQAHEGLSRMPEETDEAYLDRTSADIQVTERRLDAMMKADARGEPLSAADLISAGEDEGLKPEASLRAVTPADATIRARAIEALARVATEIEREVRFWESARTAVGEGLVGANNEGTTGFVINAPMDSMLATRLRDTASARGYSEEDIGKMPEGQRDAFYKDVWYTTAAEALAQLRRDGKETENETLERLGLRNTDGTPSIQRIRDLFSENPSAITSRLVSGAAKRARERVVDMTGTGTRGRVDTTNRLEVAKLADELQVAAAAVRARETLAHLSGAQEALASMAPILEEALREAAEGEGLSLDALRAALPDTVNMRAIADSGADDVVAGFAKALRALEEGFGPAHRLYPDIRAMRKKLSETM